ncbi:efflux RND transporter periplasmic adaptor subunit [Magnetovibrio sp. PR-2]|uniref:efflux RND transporter periplasmic adaptor subunit n=1 Tax=Magnetovibrio sp. PR-2 TaxID=3120356 RepID=UPI002FCE411F
MKTIVKFFLLALSLSASTAFADDPFKVAVSFVQDQKAVFATVESVDVVAARARIGGTVTEMLVDEGSAVTAGQKIARVVDDKVALQLKSVDEQIQSLKSQLALDDTELSRSEKLFQSGTIPKARLDSVRTKREVSARALSSVEAEREVLEQTRVEGDVLAPAAGRILKVNVRKGSVVLPGEAIANMAAEAYILRLQLPERHAMFIKEGDKVFVAERGLGALKPDSRKNLKSGSIRQVYPEIKQGRVAADVEVPDLGDFFVGERIRVWIGTGNRPAIVVPEDYLYTRYGLTYVKLSDGLEVVVQPGLPQNGGVEVLTGLKAGDQLVKP